MRQREEFRDHQEDGDIETAVPEEGGRGRGCGCRGGPGRPVGSRGRSRRRCPRSGYQAGARVEPSRSAPLPERRPRLGAHRRSVPADEDRHSPIDAPDLPQRRAIDLLSGETDQPDRLGADPSAALEWLWPRSPCRRWSPPTRPTCGRWPANPTDSARGQPPRQVA